MAVTAEAMEAVGSLAVMEVVTVVVVDSVVMGEDSAVTEEDSAVVMEVVDSAVVME